MKTRWAILLENTIPDIGKIREREELHKLLYESYSWNYIIPKSNTDHINILNFMPNCKVILFGNNIPENWKISEY